MSTSPGKPANRMTSAERRALLFTLAATEKHVCARQAHWRKVLREAARELERLDRQASDVEQSITYLREM